MWDLNDTMTLIVFLSNKTYDGEINDSRILGTQFSNSTGSSFLFNVPLKWSAKPQLYVDSEKEHRLCLTSWLPCGSRTPLQLLWNRKRAYDYAASGGRALVSVAGIWLGRERDKVGTFTVLPLLALLRFEGLHVSLFEGWCLSKYGVPHPWTRTEIFHPSSVCFFVCLINRLLYVRSSVMQTYSKCTKFYKTFTIYYSATILMFYFILFILHFFYCSIFLHNNWF